MELIQGDIQEHKNQNIMAESEFAEWILHHHHQDGHALMHDDNDEL